jgi:hypothetical protein
LIDAPVRIWDLPKAKSEILPESARLLIDQCYPQTDYAIVDSPLSNEEIREYGPNNRIASYEHGNVSDMRVAFVVDGRGRVTAVFQYSL